MEVLKHGRVEKEVAMRKVKVPSYYETGVGVRAMEEDLSGKRSKIRGRVAVGGGIMGNIDRCECIFTQRCHEEGVGRVGAGMKVTEFREAEGGEDVAAHEDGKASARGVVGVVVEYPGPCRRKVGGRGEPCLLEKEDAYVLLLCCMEEGRKL